MIKHEEARIKGKDCLRKKRHPSYTSREREMNQMWLEKNLLRRLKI